VRTTKKSDGKEGRIEGIGRLKKSRRNNPEGGKRLVHIRQEMLPKGKESHR